MKLIIALDDEEWIDFSNEYHWEQNVTINILL